MRLEVTPTNKDTKSRLNSGHSSRGRRDVTYSQSSAGGMRFPRMPIDLSKEREVNSSQISVKMIERAD